MRPFEQLRRVGDNVPALLPRDGRVEPAPAEAH